MIKRYNESDYNLQPSFLVSLRSSEGDWENTKSFYFYYLRFLPETEDIVTLYDDKYYYVFLRVSQGNSD